MSTKKKTTKKISILPKSGTKYMIQSAYAEARDITPPRVSHLIKKKIIVLVEGLHNKKKHRLIDVKQADTAIAALQNPSRNDQRKFKNGTAPPPKSETPDDSNDTIDFQKEVAREKKYKAALAKLDYEERKGTLVNAADVEKVWTEHIIPTKAKLRSIPDKNAQKIIHTVLNNSKKSERDLIVLVKKIQLQDIDEALEGIANGSK